ncbi:MAG: hypothetical protein V3W14_05675 [Candidatus Neomarinimicrobiota bacterium]
MKYTVYIFKCLHSGTHSLGVTTDLSASLATLLDGSRCQRFVSPELIHVEQHDDPVLAHQRLQEICREWHRLSDSFILLSLCQPGIREWQAT